MSEFTDLLKPNAIPQVEVKVGADDFENAIRAFGVGNACEWFGHDCDDEFAKETVRVLVERVGEDDESK